MASTALEFAAAGAAASMSLSDVKYSDTGKKEGSQFNLIGLATIGLAGGAIVLGLLAMLAESWSVVTVVAGVCAIGTAPITLAQRWQLSKMSTFREVHNELRQDVMRISNENTDLENQIERMTQKVERVQVVEANLDAICKKQGSSATEFSGLVKSNGELLKEMEHILEAQVAQQLIATLVMADRDQDLKIDEKEINELIMRVKGIKGVENLDEKKLRLTLKQNSGLEAIYYVIKDMRLEAKRGGHSMVQVSSRRLVM